MSRLARGALAACVPACVLLAGCAGDFDELQTWLEGARKSTQPRVKPLQPPRKFEPDSYGLSQTADPFSPQKMAAAIRQEAAQPNSLLAAELVRRKEPLESYPLETIAMVGSLARQGNFFALLRVDNLVYMVKPGDHLGQNYGRVTKVEETRVEIRELIQDASGDWVARTAALQLQDRSR